MMHKCSTSQGNILVGPCSCGDLFHSESNSFSMPNHKSFEETDMHHFTSSSSSSSVDCTLSLGTPSTRLYEDDTDKLIHRDCLYGNSYVSKFCLGLLKNKNIPYSQQSAKASRESNDPLLVRRCANCDTTSTPLWRNGPRGPKSLCNACGIRYKKEEERATNASNNSSGATASMLEQLQHHGYGHQNNSWVHHSKNQKMLCFSPVNLFRFI